jgi:toxin CptA
MKSAPAISFEYRPSRWLASAMTGVAALALIGIAVSGIDGRAKVAFACFVVAYGIYELRRFLKTPWNRILWHDAGHWRIANRKGTEHVAELRGSIVRGDFVVLNLDSRAGKHALILAPDNSDADLRRRLRVRLARISENAER